MNLSYEEMDDIVTQGVELGTYVYLFTGGEPLVRKTDRGSGKGRGRSTNYQNMESAKEFSDKCVENAEKWAPVAERLWDETQETKRLSKEADACTACGRCASGR